MTDRNSEVPRDLQVAPDERSQNAEYECPKCGRSDFATENAMKSHYGQVHDGSIAGVKTECHLCGESERKQRQTVEDSKNSFCSKECLARWRSENRSGKNSPGYNKQKVECEYCGEEIIRQPWKIDGADRHFCNNDCRSEWREDNWSHDPDSFTDSTVEVKCDNCREIISREPWRLRKYEHQFCDEGCYGDWISDNRRKESNPNWDGGAITTNQYGSNWEQQRKKARVRDQNQCQSCGCSGKTHMEKHGTRLHVHHITPIRHFRERFSEPEWYERGNELDNLVTLCASCHTSWEKFAPLNPLNV